MAEKAKPGKNYILVGGWLRLTYAFVDTNANFRKRTKKFL